MGVKLSIIIPTHQRSDLLRRCLASVQKHSPPQTEVIVVDDASPQGSVGRVCSTFSGIRELRLDLRKGFCAAVNVGIRASRGEIVEVLNDDTEVSAGWATAAVACFDDPRVGAVAPLVLTGREGRIIDSAGDRYYLGGVAGKRGHGQPLGPAHLEPRPVFGASGSSAFYRREALDRVGGFPESFGAYFDDVDLAFRLQRAGFQTIFQPRSRVWHAGSSSYGRLRRRLLEQQSTNEERVFWRNMPRCDLARALPRHLAVLAGKAWRRWQEGTLTPFLWGRLRILREIPDLLRHRRRLAELGPAAPAESWLVEARFWA
jgi:GT2 family glycosyltransferase